MASTKVAIDIDTKSLWKIYILWCRYLKQNKEYFLFCEWARSSHPFSREYCHLPYHGLGVYHDNPEFVEYCKEWRKHAIHVYLMAKKRRLRANEVALLNYYCGIFRDIFFDSEENILKRACFYFENIHLVYFADHCLEVINPNEIYSIAQLGVDLGEADSENIESVLRFIVKYYSSSTSIIIKVPLELCTASSVQKELKSKIKGFSAKNPVRRHRYYYPTTVTKEVVENYGKRLSVYIMHMDGKQYKEIASILNEESELEQTLAARLSDWKQLAIEALDAVALGYFPPPTKKRK